MDARQVRPLSAEGALPNCVAAGPGAPKPPAGVAPNPLFVFGPGVDTPNVVAGPADAPKPSAAGVALADEAPNVNPVDEAGVDVGVAAGVDTELFVDYLAYVRMAPRWEDAGTGGALMYTYVYYTKVQSCKQ